MNNEASEIKNLTQGDAIKKFKELVDHQSVCLFTTQLTKVPLTTRPMGIQKVCDQEIFGFSVHRTATKTRRSQLIRVCNYF